ncbi:MAG: hypothetical protein CBD97_01435 [Pelagibacteraceae bacterium TMED237]|nr:MAG: hypothetical protein CBD97_01435 [Pelagibacteraceae bacterium TMED237]
MLIQLKKNNYISYLFIFIFFLSITNAQTYTMSIDLGINPSNENLWWIKNNNFGFKNYPNYQNTKIKINKSDFEFELNMFSNLDELNKVSLNESYIKFFIKENTYFKIGRYYRDFSKYLNDDLSSGSILISNNSQAMPKVGIVSKKNLLKNNKISFDYGIAHAIFDKNDIYSSSPFLHEKFFYLNIKNKNTIFSIGFIHEAIWGGTIESEHRFSGKQPQSISDFLKVFISGDGPDDFPHANALGNHLGIWDFSFQRIQGDKNFKAYYQHIFEDTSGLRFDNKTDGLWGIELKNYIKNTSILLEYINTKNQYLDPPYVGEDYYNHGLYRYGWSYKNYTLGNPFISHLNPIATDYIYFGLSGLIQDEFHLKLKCFRELSRSSIVNYKVEVMKNFKNDYLIGAVIFKNKKESFGLKLIKEL